MATSLRIEEKIKNGAGTTGKFTIQDFDTLRQDFDSNAEDLEAVETKVDNALAKTAFEEYKASNDLAVSTAKAKADAATPSQTFNDYRASNDAAVASALVGNNKFIGLWNASTNTPALTAVPPASGYYEVSVAGTQTITGASQAFAKGDIIRSNGTAWIYSAAPISANFAVKRNAWVAQSYTAGIPVTYNGKFYTSIAAATSGQNPTYSAYWAEDLAGYTATSVTNRIAKDTVVDFSTKNLFIGYANATGAVVVNTNYRSVQMIPVSEGDTIYHSGITASAAVVAYDSAKVFKSVLIGAGTIAEKTAIVPAGVAFVTFSANINTNPSYYFKVSKLQLEQGVIPDLSTNVAMLAAIDAGAKTRTNRFSTQLDVAIPLFAQNGYVSTAGVFAVNEAWRTTDFYPVLPGDIIKFKGSTTGSVAAIVLFNADKSAFLVALGSYSTPDVEFLYTVPAGWDSVRLSGQADVAYQFAINCVFIKAKRIDFTGVEIGGGTSPSGKIITPLRLQTGMTSIDYADSWQAWVRTKITWAAYNNVARAGFSLAEPPVAPAGSFINDRTTWPTNFDVFVITGPTNDFKKNIPIGTFETDYMGNTGMYTFYGALRLFVDWVYSKNLKAKIIMFTALQRDNDGYTSYSTNTAGHKLNDYNEAYRVVCRYESLYLGDTWTSSGWNLKNILAYSNDKLHPIEAGYNEILGPFYYSHLKFALGLG